MRFFRVGICCLLAFAVLSFGAVEEWSQAVLEVGAAVLLVVWAIRQYRLKAELLSIPPEFLPLCAFALVVVVQLAFHLTASRYYTRIELQLLITYLIVVFLMSQAFSRRGHWRAFVWFLMALGFFVSVFGILQHLTFNGKLYWFRVMRFGGVPFGPYVNRNHFAGFAEMVIPVALVPLVLGKVRRERLFLVALFALVPIVALLLSASRGGIVSFAVQMVILFLLLLIRRVRSKYVIVGGMVVLSAVMAVSWIGVTPGVGALFRNPESRGDRRQTRSHATGYLAAVPRPPDHRNRPWNAGNGLSAVRFAVRRKGREPCSQ